MGRFAGPAEVNWDDRGAPACAQELLNLLLDCLARAGPLGADHDQHCATFDLALDDVGHVSVWRRAQTVYEAGEALLLQLTPEAIGILIGVAARVGDENIVGI
jgi:hypothetical protein